MSNDNTKPSIGKRGGEFIILAIYLFGDVWEFWNVNHFLCLFLGVLGIFGLIWYDDALTRRQLGLLAAFLVAVAIGADWFAPPISPPEPSRGWLQPANDPTPGASCVGTNTSHFMVVMGDTGFVGPDDRPFYPIVVDFCQFLRLKSTPNGLGIDANIWDTNGARVGTIRTNGFEISGNGDYITEKTGDLSTLVIHDKAGKELLYVHYLNPNAVRVRGIFTCPKPQLTTTIVTNQSITTPRGFSGFRTTGPDVCLIGRVGIFVNTITNKAYVPVGAAPPPNPIGGLPPDPADQLIK